MFWSDTPDDDYDRYCSQRDERLRDRPKCVVCGEYIQEGHCYDFDGDEVCSDCLKEYCDSYFIKKV